MTVEQRKAKSKHPAVRAWLFGVVQPPKPPKPPKFPVARPRGTGRGGRGR